MEVYTIPKLIVAKQPTTPGQVKAGTTPIHTVVKQSFFTIVLGFDHNELYDSRTLRRVNTITPDRPLLNFSNFEIEPSLHYDSEDQKEVDFVKHKPLECKMTYNDLKNQCSVECKLNVLTSQLEDMNFRIHFRAIHPNTKLEISPILSTQSAPIKVISKPEIPKGKKNTPKKRSSSDVIVDSLLSIQENQMSINQSVSSLVARLASAATNSPQNNNNNNHLHHLTSPFSSSLSPSSSSPTTIMTSSSGQLSYAPHHHHHHSHLISSQNNNNIIHSNNSSSSSVGLNTTQGSMSFVTGPNLIPQTDLLTSSALNAFTFDHLHEAIMEGKTSSGSNIVINKSGGGLSSSSSSNQLTSSASGRPVLDPPSSSSSSSQVVKKQKYFDAPPMDFESSFLHLMDSFLLLSQSERPMRMKDIINRIGVSSDYISELHDLFSSEGLDQSIGKISQKPPELSSNTSSSAVPMNTTDTAFICNCENCPHRAELEKIEDFYRSAFYN